MVIEVSDELHMKVKTLAMAEGRPMSHVVRQLLENYVSGEAKEYQRTGTQITTEPIKPVRPISKKDQAKGRTRK